MEETDTEVAEMTGEVVEEEAVVDSVEVAVVTAVAEVGFAEAAEVGGSNT